MILSALPTVTVLVEPLITSSLTLSTTTVFSPPSTRIRVHGPTNLYLPSPSSIVAVGLLAQSCAPALSGLSPLSPAGLPPPAGLLPPPPPPPPLTTLFVPILLTLGVSPRAAAL